MAGINLGGFSIIGGKTVGTGLSSGLDTEAIVKAAVDAKTIPVTRLEDKKTYSSKQITAYSELQSILKSLQTSVDFLRNPPSIISSTTNLFSYRQAFISSNTSVAGNTYIGVAAQPNSQMGTFTLEDVILAKARTIRSDSFTSKTSSITDAAGTNNANRFSAGTFQITSGSTRATVGRVSSDTLTAGEVVTSGTTGTAALNDAFGTGGITIVTGGDFNLIGSGSTVITSSSATQVGTAGDGSDAILNVTINGVTYTSDAITANTGGGTNEIAANTTITLTNTTTGSSFQIQTGSAIVIDDQDALDEFAANVAEDLKGITFSQSRELSNFDEGKTAGTTLDGLTSAHVTLTSDAFNITDGTHGKMGAFTVSAVSAPGAGDGTISVTIGGEVYMATGLGDGADLITGNITLTSLSGKILTINIGTAGLTLDIGSDADAEILARDLNKAFGVGVDITINEGDSLTNIASAINAQKSTTGVSATIIQVGDDDFRLSIQSELTGIENAFNIVDTEDVFTSTVTFNQTQAAQDASFTLNGNLSITRSTNTITDVISGITFSLFQETPAATVVTAEITTDTTAAKDAIISFLNAYNEFRAFVGRQRERGDDGQLVEDAVIGSDVTLQTAINRTENELNKIIKAINATDPNSLASLGISFTDFPGDDENPPATNILQLDQDRLDDVLANNYDAVRRVFEFSFTSSSSALREYTRTNALAISDFEVDIDITRAVGNQVRITYVDSTTGLPVTINADFTSGGGTAGTITGKTGTVLEGFTMLYSGDGTDVIDVSVSQGIADRLYNSINDFTKSGGLIDTQVGSLKSKNDRLQADITRLNDQIEVFRERLLHQYSLLEKVITQANSLLQFLEAQLNVIFAQR